MASTAETTRKVVKILVVEDSPTQLEKLRFLLEESGFSVVAATNGKEGLAAAQANPIELVISDIVMPEMDGYTFCKALRADQTLRHLPVILLTSLADPRDVIQGLESGANNFICKPYDDRALLARVQNVLANQEIRKAAPSEMGISIFFAGQRFFITADRLQILDLLLSTYENAVNRNSELLRARDELRILNEQLEARVAERTAVLTAEIEERKRADDALRDSERRLKEAQRLGRIGHWDYDPETRRVDWSDMLFALYDRDPKLGPPTWEEEAEYYSPEDAKLLRDRITMAIETRAPYEIDVSVRLPGGRNEAVVAKGAPVTDSSGRVVRVRGTVQDVSQRKRADQEREGLQAQLAQAQRLESVGRLAGGVAHDFNNALAVILGHAEAALKVSRPADPLRRHLDTIRQAALRGADLTRQLLAFARRQTIEPKVLDPNDVVTNTLKMLRRLMGEDISLAWMPGAASWPVKMDPAQMDQILANLLVNARDAIGGVGQVTIETQNVVLGEQDCVGRPGFVPGEYVMLGVTDDGCGMGKDVLDRLFEPFFTTKPQGQGTGLGLATVYGVVKQNAGSISVESKPGKGTTFRIFLPRVVAEMPAAGAAPKATEPRGHGETVLLVEDELALLDVTSETLADLGYSVLTAANPGTALSAAQAHAGEIQLLITDVIMPEMNGRDLAERLAARRPGIRCLFVSGYTADVIAHSGVLDEGLRFLQKPFSRLELATKVRHAIDG